MRHIDFSNMRYYDLLRECRLLGLGFGWHGLASALRSISFKGGFVELLGVHAQNILDMFTRFWYMRL